MPMNAAAPCLFLRAIGSHSWWIKQSFEGARQVWGAVRWWRCQRIGGALKGCRLVEHVSAIAFVTQMLGALAELMRALAIGGRASDGEGLGHCRI